MSCFLGPSSVGDGDGDGTGDEVGVRNKSELERECCRGVSDSTASELWEGTSFNKVISLSRSCIGWKEVSFGRSLSSTGWLYWELEAVFNTCCRR